ncbi:MAG: PAS domain S-box protein [Spirochaetales bacterium]|nr:PAS domain S-box protein [Spirochaetales bacterium]
MNKSNNGESLNLQKAAEFLDALTENSTDFIMIADKDGFPVYFNKVYKEIMTKALGREMQPGIKPHKELTDKNAVAFWDSLHVRALGGEQFTVEYTHMFREDDTRHFSVSFTPIIKDGNVAGFSEITREITQRKKYEQELTQQRDFAEGLVEIAQMIILLLDTDGHILRLNKYIEQLSGYSLEDVQNRDWCSLFIPQERQEKFNEVFLKTKENKLVRGTIIPIKTKNNQILQIVWYNKVLKDENGMSSAVLFIGQDITEQLEMEKSLRHSDKMQAVGQLAGGIAHDFNNQLAGILGYIEIIRDELKDNENCLDYCDNAINIIKRAAELTSQLLAFSRKGKFLSSPLDLHKIISEVILLLQRSIDKKISIQQKLTAGNSTVTGDPTLLQSAFLNIALNARDAMPEGGLLSFSTRTFVFNQDDAELFQIEPGEYLELVISDTGVGMDTVTLSHVFEPFFTTKETGKGTGLGLAAVYGTIKSHKGAIQVESTPGHGSTFTIYLPVSKEELQKKAEIESVQDDSTGAAHILFVEDEEVVRNITTQMLERLGYHVTVFSDGEQAVQFYAVHWKKIDMVIIDMVMPIMDGKEAYLAMRKINPEIKALLASGYSLDGAAQAIIDAGVQGFIQKPFRKAELAKKISEILGINN